MSCFCITLLSIWLTKIKDMAQRLLQRLVDRLKTSCLGLVFELEKPELAITERERKRREHRTEWYKKRGARILVEEYWQPPQEPGLSSVLMSLYFLPSASKVDLDSLKILKMKVLHDLEDSGLSRVLSRMLLNFSSALDTER